MHFIFYTFAAGYQTQDFFRCTFAAGYQTKGFFRCRERTCAFKWLQNYALSAVNTLRAKPALSGRSSDSFKKLATNYKLHVARLSQDNFETVVMAK